MTTEEFYKKVGSNVAKARKEKGYSQLDLALKVGHKSVSAIASGEACSSYKNTKGENMKKHFNLEQLFKVSQALDVPIEKLVKLD